MGRKITTIGETDILGLINNKPGISQPEIVEQFEEYFKTKISARKGISIKLNYLKDQNKIFKKTANNQNSGYIRKNLWYPLKKGVKK